MTKHPDAQKWNGRYQTDGVDRQQSPPRALLTQFAHLLPKQGWALDAAAGVGINSFYLAERGLDLLAVDISEVGLQLVRQEADLRGVALDTAVCDLTCPPLSRPQFDVILNFRFLERSTFPLYRTILRPGGLLFFETFVYQTVPDDPHPYFLLPNELQQAFADWELLHYAETAVLHSKANQIAQLVARKP